MQPFLCILYYWLNLYLPLNPFQSLIPLYLHGLFPRISTYPKTTDFYLTLFPLHTHKIFAVSTFFFQLSLFLQSYLEVFKSSDIHLWILKHATLCMSFNSPVENVIYYNRITTFQLNIDEFMTAGSWPSINVRITVLHLCIPIEELFLEKYKVEKFVHTTVCRNKDLKHHIQDLFWLSSEYKFLFL